MTQDSHVPFGMPRPSARDLAEAGSEPATSNGVASVATEPQVSAPEAINVEAEARDSRVFKVIEDLDRELVGLDPVKTRIREVAALLVVDMARRRFGLEAERPNLHMCFT